MSTYASKFLWNAKWCRGEQNIVLTFVMQVNAWSVSDSYEIPQLSVQLCIFMLCPRTWTWCNKRPLLVLRQIYTKWLIYFSISELFGVYYILHIALRWAQCANGNGFVMTQLYYKQVPVTDLASLNCAFFTPARIVPYYIPHAVQQISRHITDFTGNAIDLFNALVFRLLPHSAISQLYHNVGQ